MSEAGDSARASASVSADLDLLAKSIRSITAGEGGTRALVRILTDAIELDGEQQESVITNCGEPCAKLAYLAGRQSAYRDLRSGAIRALELAGGKPPQGVQTESAGGAAL